MQGVHLMQVVFFNSLFFKPLLSSPPFYTSTFFYTTTVLWTTVYIFKKYKALYNFYPINNNIYTLNK